MSVKPNATTSAEIMLGALASVTLTPALLLRLDSERCGGNVL